jgi:alpha-N-acetylglucosaminidase
MNQMPPWTLPGKLAIGLLPLLLGAAAAAAAADHPPVLPPTPASQVEAVQGLLGRLLPAHVAAQFALAVDPAVPPGLGGTDDSVGYFSLSNAAAASPAAHTAGAAVIKVTASGGVELASGCHYYLKFHANASFSWFGDNLAGLPPAGRPLPPLPAPVGTVVRYTDDAIRFAYNDCFYAYSSMWWELAPDGR